MDIRILLFGVTKEIVGDNTLELKFTGNTAGELRSHLVRQFQKLKGLNSLLIAVNNEYAEDDTIINEKDEIALIPPVSGG